MAAIEFLLQVSAAAAGPITLWVARQVYRWKRETDETLSRNAEAIWGSDDPTGGWAGTVELVRSHETRIRRLESETGVEPPPEPPAGRETPAGDAGDG